MTSQSLFGALFVGLIIGALGRLAVPGRQPIGCLLTVLVGIVGAVGGLAIAKAAGLDWGLLVLLCQVGVAAACVAVIAAGMRRSYRADPPRRPH